MRKWFTIVALLLGGVILAGCATGVTTTVRLGFRHDEAVNEVDGTGDTNGWSLGGDIGFSFEENGLSAISPCIGGGFTFANTTIGEELKTVQNVIPASICTEFEMSPDDDGGA